MKALQSIDSVYLGWKYNNRKDIAVIRSRSRGDFVISIIIAFLIIFLVSQVLVHIDNTLRVSAGEKDLSLVNPFEINLANAASEAELMDSLVDKPICGWLNKNTFSATFNILDNQGINMTTEELSALVTGSKDLEGNSQEPYQWSGIDKGFYINTTVN